MGKPSVDFNDKSGQSVRIKSQVDSFKTSIIF